nr:translation initiation factor IF-2-like [Pongo pygmaeus]
MSVVVVSSQDWPPNRPAGQEQERRKSPGESAPGSLRGSAGETGRGGRWRVPAHPAARAPPKAGARGPSRSPGDDKTRPRRPGLRSACGVPRGRALPAATPPRRPGSGPPSRERSAFLLCEEHPRRPDHGRRGRGEGRRSVRYPVPQPRAPRSRKRGGKGSGLLTQTSEGRSARRGVWLPSGDHRAHYGWPCVAKFKLSLRERLPRRRNTASSGHSAKRGGGDLRAEERRPSWERGGRASGGCALGAPGRGGSGESSLGRARGGAPGGSSPGACGPGPGVCKKPWNEADPPVQHWPRQGRPFWAGYQLGAEGGAETLVPAARCRRVHAAKPHAAPKPRVSPALAASFPRETWRLGGEKRTRCCSDPTVRRSQSHALRAVGRVRD